MNLKTKQKGFTLVELLIVIVVIAILAAISIVAYNGIQNRAKTTSAAGTAAVVQKKAEAANAIASSYPQAAADFAAQQDSSLSGAGLTVSSSDITAAPSSPSTVYYEKCSNNTGVARVSYWDYTAGSKKTIYLGGTASADCKSGSTAGTWSSAFSSAVTY